MVENSKKSGLSLWISTIWIDGRFIKFRRLDIDDIEESWSEIIRKFNTRKMMSIIKPNEGVPVYRAKDISRREDLIGALGFIELKSQKVVRMSKVMKVDKESLVTDELNMSYFGENEYAMEVILTNMEKVGIYEIWEIWMRCQKMMKRISNCENMMCCNIRLGIRRYYMNERRRALWLTEIVIKDSVFYHTIILREDRIMKVRKRLEKIVEKYKSEDLKMEVIELIDMSKGIKIGYKLEAIDKGKDYIIGRLEYSLGQFAREMRGKVEEELLMRLPDYEYPSTIWMYRVEENKWDFMNMDFGFADMIMEEISESQNIRFDDDCENDDLYSHFVREKKMNCSFEIPTLKSWFQSFAKYPSSIIKKTLLDIARSEGKVNE